MERLKIQNFFIEATSFEQLMLWRENNERVPWEDDLSGLFLHVGNIGGLDTQQVHVSFSFAKIFDTLVCFYTSTSNFTDWKMIEEWIEENAKPEKYDNGTRRPFTDASNFHNALHFCEDNFKMKYNGE